MCWLTSHRVAAAMWGSSGADPVASSARTTEQKKPASLDRIRVTEFFDSKDNCSLVDSVRPVYPKQAKIARIQGIVKVKKYKGLRVIW